MNTPVAVVMGSRSDWETMKQATEALNTFGIGYHAEIISAHRTPERLFEFSRDAHRQGYQVIIAGAGGAAHLPGMIAALTPLPVLGVPVQSKALSGLDSLLSIVQMPKGVAVGTLAIGVAGAFNAGLMAVQMLASHDPALQQQLLDWKQARNDEVRANSSLDDC